VWIFVVVTASTVRWLDLEFLQRSTSHLHSLLELASQCRFPPNPKHFLFFFFLLSSFLQPTLASYVGGLLHETWFDSDLKRRKVFLAFPLLQVSVYELISSGAVNADGKAKQWATHPMTWCFWKTREQAKDTTQPGKRRRYFYSLGRRDV
jgi:hypothetical protein